jgi:hypothetical protein
MQPKPYDQYLAIARQAPLFLTPARQPFVNLPTGAVPLYSEDFRGWFSTQLLSEDLSFPSPITCCRILRQLDEDAHKLPYRTTQPANLRVESTPGGYRIDLHDAEPIHVSGKQWLPQFSADTSFFRPETNHNLTTPTESTQSLPEHLQQAFGLDETNAVNLSQWLQQAMRPDQICPLLVITGDYRDEATRAVRELIDPSTCAILPLPVTQNQMGEMAIYNRVLAFSIFGSHLSPTKSSALRSISQGTGVRLRHSNPQRGKLREQLHRPVILSAEVAPTLCHNQIHIEINQCQPLHEPECLAALLDELVKTIRNEHTAPESIPFLAQTQTFLQIPMQHIRSRSAPPHGLNQP